MNQWRHRHVAQDPAEHGASHLTRRGLSSYMSARTSTTLDPDCYIVLVDRYRILSLEYTDPNLPTEGISTIEDTG